MTGAWEGTLLDKCFCYITQTACPSRMSQPLCHSEIAQLLNVNANLIIYFGFRFCNGLYLKQNLVPSYVFLQLDNYKAFQFPEQEINDTKISSYLKAVLCTSRDALLESVMNSLKIVLWREGWRHSLDSTSDSKDFFMLWANVLSKAIFTRICLSDNVST